MRDIPDSFKVCEKYKEGNRLVQMFSNAQSELEDFIYNLNLSFENFEETMNLESVKSFYKASAIERTYFINKINAEIKANCENDTSFGVLYINIDNYRQITALTKDYEDFIKKIHNELSANYEDVYWIDIDKFGIIVENIKNGLECKNVAEKIFSGFDSIYFGAENHKVRAVFSIGAAVYPYDGKTADNLILNAEKAIHPVDHKSKNNFNTYDAALENKMAAKLILVEEIKTAIRRNEFLSYYQPIVNNKTGTVEAVEALIRWQHPKRGLLPPFDFIPVAEEEGLTAEIDELILRNTCTQIKELEKYGHDISLNVNFSMNDFKGQQAVKVIKNVISDTGFAAEKLNIEITETAAVRNFVHMSKVINELKNIGIGFFIDDYGTGYASTSYLLKIPIDHIKIDHAFIKDIAKNQRAKSIVAGIINLAHSIGIGVTIEGIESMSQLKLVKELRCDKIQGYLISKPLPFRELVNFLDKKK